MANYKYTPVNVQFTIVWEIIVDNKRHLLYINASSPNISRNQHTTSERRKKHSFSREYQQANYTKVS